jgi:fumarate hydratase subunit alpha
MKKINSEIIRRAVAHLCIEANIRLRKDVRAALSRAIKSETNPRAKRFLSQLLDNARIAQADKIALCQDTGLPTVFVEIGRDVNTQGLDMDRAIQKGIEDGYRKGFLRNSIVSDPLLRPQPPKFSPGVIHYDFGLYRGLRITVLPKGFGCENKTQLKMFTPTVPLEEIKKFIISVVKDSGPDACPPYVVGVGIGGSADQAVLLAKKALLRPLDKCSSLKHIASLEKDLLKKINQANIGPLGLGGRTTSLGVSVLTAPTHIAGLPVAVSISCHALRSASVYFK